MKEVKIEKSWGKQLSGEFEKVYFLQLRAFIKKQYTGTTVYPQPKNIFKAFEICPFNNVRVVILGQDPYHNVGQAHGLSFSIQNGVAIPPSLQNIFKEIKTDIGCSSMQEGSGNLEDWAKQGVLLLNATLTVEAHKAGSHQGKGWEVFTDVAIEKLSQNREGIVFMLWGKYAKEKGKHIERSKHLVLEAPHPSPFSAHTGFFGCKHFSKTNTYLRKKGEKEIEW